LPLSLWDNGAFTADPPKGNLWDTLHLEGAMEMKASHARLASAPDEKTMETVIPERRREGRTKARYRAVLQFSDGAGGDVELADISMHGCSVRSETEDLRIGRFVSIGIDAEPMLQAVIRWVRDGTAGMEFLRPIPPERDEWHELMDMPF